MSIKRICIYGKGGIGKSTTVANLAAAMADDGLRVAVVGCDPKADSTRNLMGRKIPSVLETLKNRSGEVAFYGYRDILCIESGGPEPGSGCAGRGIIAAMEEIRRRDLLADRDVVIYDVLGDVVCGGFSMPLREEIADEVYLVTTSDYMALYAANNICRGIQKYARTGNIRLGGMIYNERSSMKLPEVVTAFAAAIGTEIIGCIPMSRAITGAEIRRKTVVEMYPGDGASLAFRELGRKILGNEKRCIPAPMTDEEVEALWNGIGEIE